MSSATIKRLNIEMTGGRPLYDASVRRPIIDVLLENPKLTPEIVSVEERGGDPFDYEDAVAYFTGSPDSNTLYLRRKKLIKYELSMFLHKEPALLLECDPKTDAKHWPQMYALAEGFANAYQPDLLWVRGLITQEFDPKDELSRNIELMNSIGTTAPIFYRRKGPAGLGLRTVLGPLLIEQIGLSRLMSLPPLTVTKSLPWGGICIDLLPEPWTRSLEELSNAWVACMKHLEPAGFFSTMTLNDYGDVDYGRPDKAGWNPGGLVR